MRRTSAETRQLIIDAAYTLCYQRGFLRTGVDTIAQASGITKRTLYQHFSSKDELIGAVLEYQHRLALQRIRQWAETLDGTPQQMVTTLFDKLARWAGEPQWHGSGFTRAAVEFVDQPGHPARKAACRHKAEVETYLARKFAARGLPASSRFARELVVLIEGYQALVLIHRHDDYIAVASNAAAVLLRSHQQAAAG